MDETRFDQVTRSLGSALDRRGALRVALAAALGPIVAATGRPTPVAARKRCKEFGQQCNSDEKCCAGKCSPKGICHCHHYQRRCGDRKCCPKKPADFARCCPDAP